jgi:APA family basic amino acid/polyamine antiporter
LILSSLTAVLLLTGSFYSLMAQTEILYPAGSPEPGRLGYTMLLLFWAIIGWEVIGNYVEEVERPEKTIMRSMKISVGAIILIYMISAFALQNRMQYLSSQDGDVNMSLVLVPLFGEFAYILMGVIAAGLCFCTLLMILGAVTRQIAVRAENGKLPAFLRMKPHEKAPKRALLLLSGWHACLLLLIHFQLLSVEGIVGIANTFFIGNALLGLAASMKFLNGFLVKTSVTILMIALTILLAFSSLFAWIILAALTAATVFKAFSPRI